ncbi:GntR family transcriptional regulator / MocR family aminotransferase [Actinoplanes regularis]|uniref:GntR family transcriptional regulator / MocR family aminotransferase n=1 Tax=Actinoplanes regularis TaxID=52697 RepID=A0A239K949_9ACTN|nr:GntR family transcriptional regulator / MocR family aminotransferase [Actinoplanes regularis]
MNLDRTVPEPLRQQLLQQMREAIRCGALQPGEPLPSTRRLAEQAGVSRGLVVDCYEQLLAEGYLEAIGGSGTRVAAGAGSSRPAPRPDPTAGEAVADGAISFEYGIPDLASVPLSDWLWALTEAIRTVPAAGLADEDPAGSLRLREVLTAYHRRVRAGYVTAGDAVVVSGFRHGLAIVLAALARHGITDVALEDPGPREHDEIVRRAGAKVVAVPVDDDGLDVATLRRSAARAVLVTPAHQCPTGAVLSPQRRRDLVAWAKAVDGVILEDDYDAEFRYDRQPVGSLHGLDPDRVIALGSVSKTFAPALRIGWLLTPPAYRPAVLDEKRFTTRGVPALDQTALAYLIESGRFDRHLRRMRTLYAARRETLAAAVEADLPGLRLSGLAAGCHAVLKLPPNMSEAKVVAGARARSVIVRGLNDYRLTSEGAAPALVLGFGNTSESRIRAGVRALAEELTTGSSRS